MCTYFLERCSAHGGDAGFTGGDEGVVRWSSFDGGGLGDRVGGVRLATP